MEPEERQKLIEDGKAAFNRGEFYEAHEFWEEVWLTLEDPEHKWLQGLIQVATGFHKLVGGHASPATSLLGRALDKLADCPADFDGVDVAAACRIAREMLAGLKAGALPDPRGARI